MDAITEFVYRIPGKSTSGRPGAHRSHSRGPGLAFSNYVKLLDYPDPRRLDLRASITDVKRDWLVRATHQSSATGVYVIADVSGSMRFGANDSKLQTTANFVESLGYSAFRSGDALGMMAFDNKVREELSAPARNGRGAGYAMANSLRDVNDTITTAPKHPGPTADTLSECAIRISPGTNLVFLVSDFHWPLDILDTLLDQLSRLLLVPIVVWDKAESAPPLRSGWLRTHDIETGRQNSLWLNDKTRKQWQEKINQRRDAIKHVFTAHDITPFFMEGGFNAEALSRHFIESAL